MQHCFLFQKSCKNQFSFFWELCLQKIFQKFIWIHHLSSKNDRDCIYQPKFGLEFNALIFNLSVQFFGLMIHSRTPDFNFSTSGSLRVFWIWGFALELRVSILNIRIQFWVWGFDLELQAWIFELEDSILNLKIYSWTPGSSSSSSSSSPSPSSSPSSYLLGFSIAKKWKRRRSV